jgi:hypothetical protein
MLDNASQCHNKPFFTFDNTGDGLAPVAMTRASSISRGVLSTLPPDSRRARWVARGLASFVTFRFVASFAVFFAFTFILSICDPL